MQVCDFGRSFFTFRIDMRKKKPITVSQPPPFSVNNARFTVEARCRIDIARSGKRVEYLLGGNCKSEQVNVTKGVWHQPNADMTMIVSDEEFMIVKSWDRNNKGVKLHPPTLGDQPERQVGRGVDAFDSLRIDLRMVEAETMKTPGDVVTAALANRCLVGQTQYAAHDGSRVFLEYPIKILNISDVDGFYQTDTGPILWPDAANGWGESPIATLRRAFIAHNCPGWAELIVEMPTPLSDTISVNHYSRSERLDGVTNHVLAL